MALHSSMLVNIQYSLLGVAEQNVIHMNSLVVLSSIKGKGMVSMYSIGLFFSKYKGRLRQNEAACTILWG